MHLRTSYGQLGRMVAERRLTLMIRFSLLDHESLQSPPDVAGKRARWPEVDVNSAIQWTRPSG